MNKRIIKNVVLVTISLLVVLLILEITLRLTRTQKWPVNYYCRDKLSKLISASPNYTGYNISEFGKSIIITNKYGFRGPVFNSQKKPCKKVLILGDSFVLARQVNYEETFGSLLSQEEDISVQVMQVGVPTWGQGDQLQWLRTYCDQLRPDIVVVAVYLGNDLPIDNMKKDNIGSSTFFITKKGLVNSRPKQVKLINKIKQYTYCQSELYLLVRQRIALLTSNKIVHKKVKGEKEFILSPHDHARLPIYLKDKDKRGNYYHTFFKLIEQFISLGKEKNFKVCPVIIPWHPTLKESYFNHVLAHYGLSKDEYSGTIPQTVIANYMKKNKIDYIDLYDVFLKKGNQLHAYGKKDKHFSSTGHKWVSQALIRYFDQNNKLLY